MILKHFHEFFLKHLLRKVNCFDFIDSVQNFMKIVFVIENNCRYYVINSVMGRNKDSVHNQVIFSYFDFSTFDFSTSIKKS